MKVLNLETWKKNFSEVYFINKLVKLFLNYEVKRNSEAKIKSRKLFVNTVKEIKQKR